MGRSTIREGTLENPRTWMQRARRWSAPGFALLVTLVVLLDGCGPTSSSGSQPAASTTPLTAATATPTTTPTATRTPTLLFEADWSKGLAGWKATPGWSVVGEVLQNDGGEERSVTVPYQVVVSDYAVEYRLQVVPSQASGFCDFAAAPTPDRYGYIADLSPISTAPHAPSSTQLSIFLDPQPADQVIMYHDFSPGSDFRTYRIEVRGPSAKLYVAQASFGTVTAESDRAQTLSGGPLTLTCSGVIGRVASLALYAL